MTAEALAVTALKQYLLATLPARVTTLNAANNAVLRAGLAGPYEVPVSGPGTALMVGATRADGTSVSITGGTRTAAQVATDINANGGVSGITASADSAGRLVLTATAAPTVGSTIVDDTPSVVAVGPGDNNPLWGWDKGGESVVTSALRAPRHKHIRDGWPGRAPDGAAGHFWVIIGDRKSTPVPEVKQQREEYLVELAVDVLVPQGTIDARTRERISQAVRAIREVLETPSGRNLGAFNSGIMLCRMGQCRIAGMPFAFESKESATPNPLFDAATMTVGVRCFVASLA